MSSCTIVSFNVNSIRKISDRLNKSINEWIKDIDADIYCFQETKEQIKSIDYKSIWNNHSKKNYAGVATYAKNNYERIESNFNGSEGRIIITEHKLFVLINVYCPNPGKDNSKLDQQLEFYDKMFEHTQMLIDKGKNVIIVGDINTALSNLDTHNPRSKLACSGIARKSLNEWMQKLDLIDVHREKNPKNKEFTTFYNSRELREKGIGWRLDYFFIQKKLLPFVKEIRIMSEVDISDHCPIEMRIEINSKIE